MGFPRQISLTQGWIQCFLHCRRILYQQATWEAHLLGLFLLKYSWYTILYWFQALPWWLRVKSLPAMWETQVWSLGWEDLLEKEMATHSSILAWKIPWTKEPGGLQSTRSQRVWHDWATNTHQVYSIVIKKFTGYIPFILTHWLYFLLLYNISLYPWS